MLYGQTAHISTGLKLYTEAEKVFVHLQKKLVFKVARIQSRSSWTEDKSCDAEEPFTGR